MARVRKTAKKAVPVITIPSSPALKAEHSGGTRRSLRPRKAIAKYPYGQEVAELTAKGGGFLCKNPLSVPSSDSDDGRAFAKAGEETQFNDARDDAEFAKQPLLPDDMDIATEHEDNDEPDTDSAMHSTESESESESASEYEDEEMPEGDEDVQHSDEDMQYEDEDVQHSDEDMHDGDVEELNSCAPAKGQSQVDMNDYSMDPAGYALDLDAARFMTAEDHLSQKPAPFYPRTRSRSRVIKYKLDLTGVDEYYARATRLDKPRYVSEDDLYQLDRLNPNGKAYYLTDPDFMNCLEPDQEPAPAEASMPEQTLMDTHTQLPSPFTAGAGEVDVESVLNPRVGKSRSLHAYDHEKVATPLPKMKAVSFESALRPEAHDSKQKLPHSAAGVLHQPSMDVSKQMPISSAANARGLAKFYEYLSEIIDLLGPDRVDSLGISKPVSLEDDEIEFLSSLTTLEKANYFAYPEFVSLNVTRQELSASAAKVLPQQAKLAMPNQKPALSAASTVQQSTELDTPTQKTTFLAPSKYASTSQKLCFAATSTHQLSKFGFSKQELTPPTDGTLQQSTTDMPKQKRTRPADGTLQQSKTDMPKQKKQKLTPSTDGTLQQSKTDMPKPKINLPATNNTEQPTSVMDLPDDPLQLHLIVPQDSKRDLSDVTCPVFKRMCEIICSERDVRASLTNTTLVSLTELFDKFGIPLLWKWRMYMIDRNAGLRNIIERELWADKTALKNIGGELACSYARWYFAIVEDATKPEYVKLYHGQAIICANRMTQHFNQSQKTFNTTSLHYWIATQPNRLSHYVAMGIDDNIITNLFLYHPKADTTNLLLFFEQYLSLLFQTLPPPILRYWLPSTVPIRANIGLNVNAPIRDGFHGHRLLVLGESDDPEVCAWRDMPYRSGKTEEHPGFNGRQHKLFRPAGQVSYKSLSQTVLPRVQQDDWELRGFTGTRAKQQARTTLKRSRYAKAKEEGGQEYEKILEAGKKSSRKRLADARSDPAKLAEYNKTMNAQSKKSRRKRLKELAVSDPAELARRRKRDRDYSAAYRKAQLAEKEAALAKEKAASMAEPNAKTT